MQQTNKYTPSTLAIEYYQRLSNISSIDLTNNDISDLEFNNTPTMQIENMKYDETNKLTSIDSLIIISEDILESTYFNTWKEVTRIKSIKEPLSVNLVENTNLKKHLK
ncbi:4901_t:CDS:2 [Scutellospora calospora]|uniref:4901_t:CDS:1 n=1 Tax=Scutellospora calospora TaxID=85575 RepID=A0ACA9MTN9_9GLOM|nr:4901_t:CDS:2 [Scutellospora calospora]